ncbi:MAG TPA: VOC family protein [Halalkalibaculum sp.]|nr:VOC family protein [Halalkalibaculum sp.]
MEELTFDHYTIKVKDLESSASFYKNVLGLSEIENRTRKPHIRWFSIGNGTELHIVEGDIRGIRTNVGVHLALKLKDFDSFIAHLKSKNILLHNSKARPGSITTRADGVRQVYFQDPDSYWIEVNEAG